MSSFPLLPGLASTQKRKNQNLFRKFGLALDDHYARHTNDSSSGNWQLHRPRFSLFAPGRAVKGCRISWLPTDCEMMQPERFDLVASCRKILNTYSSVCLPTPVYYIPLISDGPERHTRAFDFFACGANGTAQSLPRQTSGRWSIFIS